MATLTDLARRLNLALVAVTDERRGGDPLALAKRLPRGSRLIFRHYERPDRGSLALTLATLCRSRGIELLVAGDLTLAMKAHAGLHLPDGMAAQASPRIRLWRRRGGVLTVAAHDRRGLVRAAGLGANAALLSSVFPTLSHPGAKSLGLLTFRRLAGNADLPVVALGGIDPVTIRQLTTTPAAAVAALGALNPPGGTAPDGVKSGR